MLVLRCTTKLLSKLGLPPRAEGETSSGLLGDWYATLVRTRRCHYVLAMARNTLLPVVVSGRELRAFPLRLASAVADVLAAYGVPAEAIEKELAAMAPVRYVKTDDRSNVGVLTEFQRLLVDDLEYVPTAPLTALSLRLAHTPIVARNMFPEDATCRLFGIALPRHRGMEFDN